MFFQKIDDAVRQHEAVVDVGIGLEELHCDREDVQAAKDDRCGDNQLPFRRAVFRSPPRDDEIQLDLCGAYQSNVALYPKFQEYMRTQRPPLLPVYGARMR